MSTVHEVYRVDIHPTASAQGPQRLAELIVQRWMPNNAGGAPFLMCPGLRKALEPLFDKAKLTRRSVVVSVDTTSNRPVITEIS